MGKDVSIHPTASIGNNVTIYDGVKIGPNSIICDNCVIGEPLSGFYFGKDYSHPKTIIGSNAVIRSHSVVYAGNLIGDNFVTGHHVTIRENNNIGNNVSIGTLSDLQGESKIGNHVRLHSNVHICQFSLIEDFVMIYPYVVFTNDRYPPTETPEGPSIGSFTQIGVHAVIQSAVKIGENCLIASQSSVNIDLPSFSFFVGNPGKIKGDVRELTDINGNKLYPWPLRFDRGMPWLDKGYEKWLSER
jgi:acetyltransferase-like isoleucine patch superfamily enzyme